jgi:hypothetical protein
MKSSFGAILFLILLASHSGKGWLLPHSHQTIEKGLQWVETLPESNHSRVVIFFSQTNPDDTDWFEMEQILKLKTSSKHPVAKSYSLGVAAG